MTTQTELERLQAARDAADAAWDAVFAQARAAEAAWVAPLAAAEAARVAARAAAAVSMIEAHAKPWTPKKGKKS